MRIVCPRCVAQYEVDESAIPEAGREVQCANCEHIWFQDYIEMLPSSADEDASAEEDRGVFDDLDGKSDANFYSSRGAGPEANDAQDFENDEDSDLLSDDLDDDLDEAEYDADDDDDTPSPNIPIPPVDDEVLDVLRSEAAFSSARAQLDAAAADALDGDGATLKGVPEDSPESVDDLTAFLDAHADEDPADLEEEPAAEIEEDADEPPVDPDFDPLADLNAIRSQLDDIGSSETESEYTPNLPIDDPIDPADNVLSDDQAPPPDSFDAEIAEIIEDNPSAATEEIDADDDEPEYDDPEFDAAALTAALDVGGQDRPDLDENLEDDDFDDEDDGTRHAYRADGITPQEPDLSQADQDLEAALNDALDTSSDDETADDEQETDDGVSTAAVAVAAATGAAAAGLTRPRSKGTRSRARTVSGFEPSPPAPEADDRLTDVDPVEDTPDIDEDDIKAAVDTTRRPKQERKTRLPDVEELDASLRSEADEPRRRDCEMMGAHEEDIAKAGKGGFRRAFIWTLFIIALLIALYVLRPQIVAALPAAAMVLDPYASVVDTLRSMINGILG